MCLPKAYDVSSMCLQESAVNKWTLNDRVNTICQIHPWQMSSPAAFPLLCFYRLSFWDRSEGSWFHRNSMTFCCNFCAN